MKQLLLLIVAIFTVSFLSVSCEDSNVEDDAQSGVTPDSGYEEDLSYAPELVAVNPGYERGEFSLNLNSDGRTIQSYFLYWDNGNEMREVEVTSSSNDISDILDMAEGDYTFYVKALDSNDKISAASEKITVYIYGETLRSTLPARYIESGEFDNKKTFTITWKDSEFEGMTSTEVTYTPYLGEQTTISCTAEDATLSLPNALDEAEITITTTYLPYDNALDEIVATATTTINSDRTYVTASTIEEICAYASQSNLNITIAPGTYYFDKDYAEADTFFYLGDLVSDQTTSSVLLISGSNNYYNCKDVTFSVSTALFHENSLPGYIYHVHVIGNNNTIKGLRICDDGDRDDYPLIGGAISFVMDGSDNTMEEVYIHAVGSKPYTYGDCFGKGSGSTVVAFKKHSACMVRGDNPLVKNCTIINHGYGHFLFMQGTYNAVVEGCYLEGEMSTTDVILAEYGTGSEADLVNFRSIWGYTVPAGYTICCNEDGIRTYASGNPVIDKTTVSRGTTGTVTVRDCVIKNARNGISLKWGCENGDKYVENCQVIGCQSGITVNKYDKVVNCKADAAFGQAVLQAEIWDKYQEIEVEIMPYDGDILSGNNTGHLAYIYGGSHTITLTANENFVNDQDLYIALGGYDKTISALENEPMYASSCKIYNYTGVKIVIYETSSGNTIVTNGEVEDYGSNNTITYVD